MNSREATPLQRQWSVTSHMIHQISDTEYVVPLWDYKEGLLRPKIAKLQRVAARLGLEPPHWETVGEDTATAAIYFDKEKPPVKRLVRRVWVLFTSPDIKLNGWRFCGVIEHTEAGNILRLVGDHPQLPADYRSRAPGCDHCRTNRQRNDTYIVQQDNGEYKQVGSSCLKDFLGHTDAESYAAFAEDLCLVLQDLEECTYDNGPREAYLLPKESYLACVVYLINREGWVPAHLAQEQERTRTSESALIFWDQATHGDQLWPPEEAYEEARAAIAWAAELHEDLSGGDSYIGNLRVVARRDGWAYRDLGLAASIVPAYRKAVAKAAEEKLRGEEPSQHFGTPGKREEFEVVLVGAIDLPTYSDYDPPRTLYKFQYQGHSDAVWFTSTVSQELDEAGVGSVLIIRATVKDHGEYHGRAQTKLSRVVVKQIVSSPRAEEVPTIDELQQAAEEVSG